MKKIRLGIKEGQRGPLGGYGLGGGQTRGSLGFWWNEGRNGKSSRISASTQQSAC